MADSEMLAGCYEPMRQLGSKMGRTLAAVVEPVYPHGTDGPGCIPHDYVDDLTEFFMVAFAEAIQAWIDAGSEREATMENIGLRNAIYLELEGWSDNPQEGS